MCLGRVVVLYILDGLYLKHAGGLLRLYRCAVGSCLRRDRGDFVLRVEARARLHWPLHAALLTREYDVDSCCGHMRRRDDCGRGSVGSAGC